MNALRPLLLLLLMSLASADEWGTWDDLPNNLLSSSENTSVAIDRLYDRLKANNALDWPDDAKELDAWLTSLNLDFGDNNELQELLDRLHGESDDDIADEIEKWLQDQLDDAQDALEDELKELEKAQDDLNDDDDDEDRDELDELDELDDPDEPEFEEPDS